MPQKIEISITGMHCGGCSGTLTRMLSELPGVSDVMVDHQKGNAVLTYDPKMVKVEEIYDTVLDAGFDVVQDSLKNL